MGTPKTMVTVACVVNASIEMTWAAWTEPQHIVHWNQASDDWHCPEAENDVRPGGKIKWTMAAKDGSVSFDFEGTYTLVEPQRVIEYEIADGRHVKISFRPEGNTTHVTETFEAEGLHSVEMQQAGWQAILDSFKQHTEGL
jgi:uncharacterized protein YndB with AHSA1/START domain